MKEAEVRALFESGTFNGAGLRGTFEETHISWIILTPRFVFKIKKPLKLSFLDFSTRAKRKKYCEKEVLLNRRFSGIYLGVIAIRYHAGRFVLGGTKGKIVDYAVKMKRMKSALRMDSMLRAQKVDQSNILSLAKSIAGFHQCAPVISKPFDLQAVTDAFSDIRVVQPFIRHRLGQSYSDIITKSLSWSASRLRTHAKRLQQRIDQGFRRDVHGDLHSGNIFLYKRPVIFDCIEFNDAYRQIDVIDEIAFFCMDLEAYGEGRLSAFFAVEYAKRFPCFVSREDEEIFIFFKCYRANIRAKVKALAAAEGEWSHSDASDLEAVRKYLLLMEGYIS